MIESLTNSLYRPTTSLDEDTLYGVLANERRRLVIQHLATTQEVTLRQLATKIAAHETQQHPDEVTSTERHRVYVALYQTHLGILEDEGIITIDAVTITPTQECRVLGDLLNHISEAYLGGDGA